MNQWEKYDLEYDFEDGRTTRFTLQTDGRNHVLSSHPDNQGPHVSQVAPRFGDEQIQESIKQDGKTKPENFQLYSERRDDQGFDKWQAKTTDTKDVSQKENEHSYEPSAWTWRNSEKYSHKELEHKVGAELDHGLQPNRYQDRSHAEQSQEFRNASMVNTQETDAARAANQQANQQHKR